MPTNFVMGLTRLRFRDFVLGSWLGLIPGCLLGAYLGNIAGDVLLRDGSKQRSLGEWLLMAVGLLATVAVAIHAGRVLNRTTTDPA